MSFFLTILFAETVLPGSLSRGEPISTSPHDSKTSSSQLPLSAKAPSSANQTQASELVEKMTLTLEKASAIEVRLRRQITLLGQKMIGSGNYFQAGVGEGRRFRIDMKTPVGEEMTSLLQVCDGNYLWTYQRVGGESLTRVDMQQVRLALKEALKESADKESAEKASAGKAGKEEKSPPGMGNFSLAAGGLPALFRRLAVNFEYALEGEATLGAIPTRIVRGRWRKESLRKLLDAEKGGAVISDPRELQEFPSSLPYEVLIYIGRDDARPYRVIFQGNAGMSNRLFDSLLHQGPRPMLVLDFYDLKLDGAMDAKAFEFNPGNKIPRDQTQEYLKEWLPQHAAQTPPAVASTAPRENPRSAKKRPAHRK